MGSDPNGCSRFVHFSSFPCRPIFFSNSAVRWVFFISTTNENPRSLGKEIIETVKLPHHVSFVNNCLLLDASFKLTGREAKLKTWWTEGRTVNSRAFPSRRYLKIEVEEKRKIFPFFFFFFFSTNSHRLWLWTGHRDLTIARSLFGDIRTIVGQWRWVESGTWCTLDAERKISNDARRDL